MCCSFRVRTFNLKNHALIFLIEAGCLVARDNLLLDYELQLAVACQGDPFSSRLSFHTLFSHLIPGMRQLRLGLIPSYSHTSTKRFFTTSQVTHTFCRVRSLALPSQHRQGLKPVPVPTAEIERLHSHLGRHVCIAAQRKRDQDDAEDKSDPLIALKTALDEADSVSRKQLVYLRATAQKP